jgi:glyoxylase-like metal-dependent hydrolase (beta-lactamase superfamily II)
MNRPHHEIIPLKLGMTRCHLIRGAADYILVDAGPPNAGEKFRKKLEQLSIAPAQIKMIFITHKHFDHTGSLAAISRLTGAPSTMHQKDKQEVEKGVVIMPKGIGAWGKFLRAFLWTIQPMVNRIIEPVPVGLGLDDSPSLLDEFQISGKVLHTPGHTPGSISLVLESGEAFVGDLAMSGFPRITGPGPFVLGDDRETMIKSWQLLLDAGARKIYPAHGKPFDASVFEKCLRRTKMFIPYTL